jgi:hypothetical protein
MSELQIVVDATFDHLARVTYKKDGEKYDEGDDYQILVLDGTKGKVENRHLDEDLARFQETGKLLGYRQINNVHYFIFKDGTFGLIAPGREFIESSVWENAGKSYYKAGRWDDSNIWNEMM